MLQELWCLSQIKKTDSHDIKKTDTHDISEILSKGGVIFLNSQNPDHLSKSKKRSHLNNSKKNTVIIQTCGLSRKFLLLLVEKYTQFTWDSSKFYISLNNVDFPLFFTAVYSN